MGLRTTGGRHRGTTLHWVLAAVLACCAGAALAADVDLNVTKAKLKSGKGLPKGRFLARGDFVLPTSAGGAFTGATSVDVRVTDTIGLDESFTVPCAPPDLIKVRCQLDEPKVKVVLKYGLPGPTAVAVRFQVRAVRIPIDAPFKEPVTVTITEHPTGTVLEGSIVDCQQKNTVLSCRE